MLSIGLIIAVYLLNQLDNVLWFIWCKIAVIDGSVGICWNKYRKAQKWAQDTTTFVVTFGDKRDEARVKAKAYKNSELVYFRDWLENIYTYDRFPKYLAEKYGTLRKVD